MKKLIIMLFFILGMSILTGCNKAKINVDELKILGVNTKDIEKIEIIHGNVIVYPDLEQKDNLTLIEDFNKAFESTVDRIETSGDNLGIALDDAEAYAENDAVYYYVYIIFSKQQTLLFNNEEHYNCDGVLFDLNNLKLHWSKDGNFVGTMGFTNNTASVEKDFTSFQNEIENIFADLVNGI